MTPAEATSYAFRVRDVLHIPRRALDSMTVEVAILIGELCETPEQAEKLTAAILAAPWGRFELAEFRRRIQAMSGRTPPQQQPAPNFNFDPTGPFSKPEWDFLSNYAKRERLTFQYQGNTYPDVYTAEGHLRAHAERHLSEMTPELYDQLLDHCRQERARAFKAARLLTTPSELDVRRWAEHRIYLTMTTGAPLIPPPASVQNRPGLGTKTEDSTI